LVNIGFDFLMRTQTTYPSGLTAKTLLATLVLDGLAEQGTLAAPARQFAMSNPVLK